MRVCGDCGYECDGSWGHCEHCGRPSWFPNVDAASQPEEKEAIEQNYITAISEANAAAPGVGDKLHKFESTVSKQSDAILVRPLLEVLALFDKENALHMAFHRRLRAGGIRFDGGPYDTMRQSIDSKIFPNYFEKITFAAASLEHTGAGLTYGECHMTMSARMIKHRTSFFIGNSFHVITHLKHGDPIPFGLRSTWDDRGKLATIRNISKFTAETVAAEFPGILNDGNDDFIEAHIYGSISSKSVQRVVVQTKALKAASKRSYLAAMRDRFEELSKTRKDWSVEFEVI